MLNGKTVTLDLQVVHLEVDELVTFLNSLIFHEESLEVNYQEMGRLGQGSLFEEISLGFALLAFQSIESLQHFVLEVVLQALTQTPDFLVISVPHRN